jgi:PDZ domain
MILKRLWLGCLSAAVVFPVGSFQSNSSTVAQENLSKEEIKQLVENAVREALAEVKGSLDEDQLRESATPKIQHRILTIDKNGGDPTWKLIEAPGNWALASKPNMSPLVTTWLHQDDEHAIVQGSGGYFIGITCDPGNDQDAADSPEGVRIESVMEGAPAERSGLKAGDIIWKMGDVKIETPQQIIEIVGKSEGKPITVFVARGDEKLDFEITPTKRDFQPRIVAEDKEFKIQLPEGVDAKFFEFLHDGADRMEGAMEGMPNIIALQMGGDLPENVSIKIEKSGKQPAKITVSRDDQKWEVEEGKLDELPEDLRPMVSRMMGTPVFSKEDMKKHIEQFRLRIAPRAAERAEEHRRFFELESDAKKADGQIEIEVQKKVNDESNAELKELQQQLKSLAEQIERLDGRLKKLDK